MQKKVIGILAAVLLLVGIGLMAYPAVSKFVNRQHGSYAITDFEDQMENLAQEEIREQFRLAMEYNQAIASGEQPENYEDILNLAGGMMGYIEIPEIEVNLPIYHGVEEAVLAKGIGHMPNTTFPIGGEGNHAVLTGHTGLPSAKLFTDLNELEEGDLFYIHILDKVLCYEVDQIKTVLPSEGRDLSIVPEMDYCTLVTCTPYGINSHRLLVRGIRADA